MPDTQTLAPSDNFDAAFASFSAEQPPAAEPPKEEPSVETPESAAEPAPAPAEAPVAEQPAEGEAPAEAAAAEPEQDDEPEAPAGISDEDLLARFAALVKKTEPAQPQQPAPQQQQQAAPQAEAPALYTPEEQEFLTTYEKDWPDVAKAEALRRRAEYRDVVSYVFREIAKELQPLAETVRVLSDRTHLQDLTTTISDYEDVRDKVIDWAQAQPPYLQAAYKHVIEQGTVDEVRDLIDRYKRETGTTQQAPAPAKAKSELPAATKQAAAALAPVSSKRSAVLQASDPNDFEAAFKDFAEKFNL